jgi:hypothetical protein
VAIAAVHKANTAHFNANAIIIRSLHRDRRLVGVIFDLLTEAFLAGQFAVVSL